MYILIRLFGTKMDLYCTGLICICPTNGHGYSKENVANKVVN